MSRDRRVESVFLNIPYDGAFEDLYLAYIVGLTQLRLQVNAAVAVPNQDRLSTIITLIEQSDYSIHDLSRIEASKGIPRFNMPVELGLALYRSHVTAGKQHRSANSQWNAQGCHERAAEYLPPAWGCHNCAGNASQLLRGPGKASGPAKKLRKQDSVCRGSFPRSGVCRNR